MSAKQGEVLMRRGVGILFGCLIELAASSGAAGALDSPEAAAGIAAGDAALAAFDLERALVAYRDARAIAPESYEAAWKLSRALDDKATLLPRSDPDYQRLCVEAAAAGRAAVRNNPAGAAGHAFLAVALGKLANSASGRRKVELARETWSEAAEALRANPDDDVALHVLGRWHREVGEVNRLLRFSAKLLYGSLPPASLVISIEHLRRAVAVRPAAIPHRVELGVSLAAAGRWDEARMELERALALPDSLVIDRYYRRHARGMLERVKRHLN